MANELEPRFLVTVTLDGDDDARIQTANARFALEMALRKMQGGDLIRDYTLNQDKDE